MLIVRHRHSSSSVARVEEMDALLLAEMVGEIVSAKEIGAVS